MKKLLPLLLLLACAPAFAQKISALPAGSQPTGPELIPAVQSGATVSITAAQFLAYIQANGGGMTWPTGSASIACYSGSTSWCAGYNASNLIPANFLPAALASSNSINGVAIPATSSTAVTAPTSTTANNCYLTTTTAGLASTGACPGGSSPGGSNYSFQYNNAGALGGVLPGATGLFGLNWSSLTAAPTLTGLGSLATTTPGTGVATALGVNVGSAGAVVVNGGALGTPSSGVGTNLTGTAAALNIGGTAANITATSNSTLTTLSALASANGSTVPATAGTLWGSLNTFTVGHCVEVGSTSPQELQDAGSACGSGSMVYPGSGLALSTGSAWNSSLVPGSNTFVGNSGSGTAALTPAQAIGVLNSASANAQTGTTYTFVIGDANGEVTMSNGSSNTVTIPPNSSVAFPVGTLLTVQEVSTGVTSVGPGTGVTITSAAYGSSTSQTYSLGGVYGFIQLQQTAANTWTVVSWDTPVGQQLRALAIPSEMQAYLAASTPFTEVATGCTPSAATGGPFAGKITLASGPCTSIVITMNGATGFTDTNGYDCSVEDKTLQAAGTWFGKWGASADTTTTATIPIPSAAGSTDVISFTCTPRSL